MIIKGDTDFMQYHLLFKFIEFDKPLMHVVDREADSVKYLRRSGSVHGLTRTKKGSTFRHEGQFKTAEIISLLFLFEISE